MVEDKQIKFLPFHAINEFMKPEFRKTVIRSTLNSLTKIPDPYSQRVNNLIKNTVKIPGFRNSAKAPTSLKVKPTEAAFEKNPDLVAAILSAWVEAHSALKNQVDSLLRSRGWELLPVEADRTKLPGFLITWPKDEDFVTLNNAFNEMYPASQDNEDDISLMVVWLSGRLPYQFSENVS